MSLTPNLPPGRANRKARSYTAEIQRLREVGYSFEAIRLTLLEAGVEVSRTTVKREAAKRPVIAVPLPHEPEPRPASPRAQASPPSPAPLQPRTPHLLRSFVGDSRSGREIVEAFMQGRVTNPLMQERTTYEDRSD
jgi:hypothetical protein